MRRPSPVELMLLAAILLWALNLTVTRYILTHGFRPLAYATVRYGLAVVVFAAVALIAEGTLRISRSDLPLVAGAGLAIFSNQLCFIYALKETSASVVGLVTGATPIFAGLLGVLLRTERLSQAFWLGAALSFAGVGLVASGSGGELSGNLGGTLLAVATAATWALYSVAIAPLMRRYSPSRISTIVLGLGWVGLLLAGLPQTRGQDYALGWRIWALLAFATLGPLVATNMLWFRVLHRIGPARATLAANLQPFIGAVIAYVLLSESVSSQQVEGGACIAAGLLVARRRAPASAPAPPAE